MNKTICAIKTAIYVLSVVAVTSLDATSEPEFNDNWTPLHEAIVHATPEEACGLIANGANVNAGTRKPLDLAISAGRLDVVIDLIAAGADINALSRGPDGWMAPPLHWAISFIDMHPFEAIRFVNLLLMAGARLDVRDAEGKTPLEYAEQLAKGWSLRQHPRDNFDTGKIIKLIEILRNAQAPGDA